MTDPQSALGEFTARARTVASQTRLDTAAAEAIGAFQAAGVDALLLKGAAVARALYRTGEARGYLDVDLLVAPEDFAAAERTLERLGYVNFVRASRLVPFVEDAHATLFTRRSPAGPVAIDLHWRLPGCEGSDRTVWEALSRHRAQIDVRGQQTPVLDRTGLALHLALHAGQHGPEDEKAIGDLARALDRWGRDVWRQAAELAAQAGATEAFAAGLRLLPSGAAVARELGLPAVQELLREIAARPDRPRGTFHLKAFTEASSVRERATVLRRSLLPPRGWIVREYPWANAGGLRLIAARTAHVARAPSWAARTWHRQRRAGARRPK